MSDLYLEPEHAKNLLTTAVDPSVVDDAKASGISTGFILGLLMKYGGPIATAILQGLIALIQKHTTPTPPAPTPAP